MKIREGTHLIVSEELIEKLRIEVASLRKEIAELHSNGGSNGTFPYAPIPGLCKELGISQRELALKEPDYENSS